MARNQNLSMTDRMLSKLDPTRKSQFDEIRGDLEEAFDDLNLPNREISPQRQVAYSISPDFSIDLTKIEVEEESIRTPPKAQAFDISPLIPKQGDFDPEPGVSNEKYEKLKGKYRELKVEHSKSEVENRSTIDYLNSELTHYKNAYEDALLKIAELEGREIAQKTDRSMRSKENGSEEIIKSLIQKVEDVQVEMKSIRPFGASKSNVLGDENGRNSSYFIKKSSNSHKKSRSQIPKLNLSSSNSTSLYSELNQGSENYIMKEIAAMKERLFKAENDNTELRLKVESLCKN